MKKNVLILTMVCIAQLTLWNCTHREELPTVQTAEVTDITQTSAMAGGSILANGANVTVRGVCYSTTNNKPSVDDLHTTDGSGTGDFTSSLSALQESTTYYVRAYAMNGSGVAYGETVTFTTLAQESELSPTERLCRPRGWKLADTHIEPAYNLQNDWSGAIYIDNLLDGYLYDYEIDDILVFNANGTHYVNPGTLTNPNGYTTITSLGSWYFDNTDAPQFITMRIPFRYNEPAVQCRIGTLSDSEFTIAYSFVEDKASYTVALKYVPAE